MIRLSDTVVVFDLDGTLIDSAPDLTAALNRALQREGLDAIDEQLVTSLVGEGARALLTRGFELQGKTFPDGRRGDRLVEAYIEDYRHHLSQHSSPFPMVRETLERLKAAGAALAVCTNKVERLSEPILRDFSLSQYFPIVLSADSLPEKKPSPLPLLTIQQETGRPFMVMVGDTYTDQLAANAAGAACLIASFGYGQHDERLRDSLQFEGYCELPKLICGLQEQALRGTQSLQNVVEVRA
jgi:phosphoglycolate phosphatase